jgi:hypothetical protein
LLFALGVLLAWPMALAFAGAIALAAVKLPACTARFGWRLTLAGVGTAWVVSACAAWILSEAFGRPSCSILG